MKECINKGCSEDVRQAQKSGIDRKGKRMGGKRQGGIVNHLDTFG